MKPQRSELGQLTHPFDRQLDRSPGNHRHHFVQNDPDIKPLKRKEIRSLVVHVPSITQAPLGYERCRSRDLSSGGHAKQPIDQLAFVPTFTEPLTPVFTYSHGVIGGGGTSKEALQRAKRRLRNK